MLRTKLYLTKNTRTATVKIIPSLKSMKLSEKSWQPSFVSPFVIYRKPHHRSDRAVVDLTQNPIIYPIEHVIFISVKFHFPVSHGPSMFHVSRGPSLKHCPYRIALLSDKNLKITISIMDWKLQTFQQIFESAHLKMENSMIRKKILYAKLRH